MSGIGRRLRKEEDGYALVVSVILLFVMMMLLVVGLQAGNSALDQSQRGIEWTRTLTVAESGINDALSRLSGDRAAVLALPDVGFDRLHRPRVASTRSTGPIPGESVVITSTGYYPAPRHGRDLAHRPGHARARADVPLRPVLRGLPGGQEQPGRDR